MSTKRPNIIGYTVFNEEGDPQRMDRKGILGGDSFGKKTSLTLFGDKKAAKDAIKRTKEAHEVEGVYVIVPVYPE